MFVSEAVEAVVVGTRRSLAAAAAVVLAAVLLVGPVQGQEATKAATAQPVVNPSEPANPSEKFEQWIYVPYR
ncbi:MAG: hypothetical protein VB861_01985, partial [Planctomycetaceae bacterium]